MSLSRRNPRRDGNEKPIVDELEKCGVQCFRISGKNLPDVLCYFNGKWQPLGIKPEKGAKLTPAEKAGVSWPLVTTFDQAAVWVGLREIR
jgi:hypothetical protein